MMAVVAIATKAGNAAKLSILGATSLKRLPWLVHGFSTRRGGFTTCYGGRTLNLGYTKEDSREAVDKNRRRFLLAMGAGENGKSWPLITLKQVHSDVIHVIRSQNPGSVIGDGLVTNVPRIVLGIQTADCFPVLLVDRKNRAIGAFHAGWRGTLQRIVEKGLGAMRREYGTQPRDVSAVIGPGIQKCCYEVGEELKGNFESQFDYGSELFHEVHAPDPVKQKYPMLFMTMRPPGHGPSDHKLFLDLLEANRRQLIGAGVPVKQILCIHQCTSCSSRLFFSYRADKGTTGRMIAVIGIKTCLQRSIR